MQSVTTPPAKRTLVHEIVSRALAALKESDSHEAKADLAVKLTEDIISLWKPKSEIVHVIGPKGEHRLQVDGDSTPWMGSNEIARQGDYIATTDWFNGQLPQVGRVLTVDPAHFRTHAQQTLKLDTVRFSTADKL